MLWKSCIGLPSQPKLASSLPIKRPTYCRLTVRRLYLRPKGATTPSEPFEPFEPSEPFFIEIDTTSVHTK